MHCYKICSIKRDKENEYTEYLKYYFFPNKLVSRSSISNKIKAYKLESKSKVEEKFNKILQTKIGIGFSVLNDNIDPIFYNQYNDASKGFNSLFKNESGIQDRRSWIIKDNDDDNFPKPYSELDKKHLLNKFQGCDNLINLYSTFSNLDFQVDLDRHGMQYVYRFTASIWDNDRWSNNEPFDKFDCELGRSILAFAVGNNGEEKVKLWTRISKIFNRPTPIKTRFSFLSKGIISFIDLTTEKVYSVEAYEPKYNKPIKSDDIVVHENPVEFMAYVWNRLEEDIFYSMKYN